MKPNTRFSFIGSFLVAFTLASVSVHGQATPTPGPEHEQLKKLEGTWNAKIKMGDEESAATATYKMICGGMWLQSDFQGQFRRSEVLRPGTGQLRCGKEEVCVGVGGFDEHPTDDA